MNTAIHIEVTYWVNDGGKKKVVEKREYYANNKPNAKAFLEKI